MSPVVAPRLDGGDAAHHRLIGHFDQPLGTARDFADGVHAARIAMPVIEDQGHVDIEDIAVAQRLVRRDAVADHVVDRRTGRLAVAAVHQRGRHGAMVLAELVDQAVDPFGGHSGLDLRDQHVEALGGQPAGPAHAFECGRPVDLDLPGFAQRRRRRLNIGHRGNVSDARESGGQPPFARNVSIRVGQRK